MENPDRLHIDKADRDFYNHDMLQNELFQSCTNKEQFLFAMAVGFKNGVNWELKTQDGFLRTEYLREEDEALIDAVALYHSSKTGENPVEILSDRDKVFVIAEEYAHAGIKLIYDNLTSGQPGSFFKKLELDLFTQIHEM